MTGMPWPNRIMIGALLVLSAVQLCLAYQFWGSFGSGQGFAAVVFQVLGISLAVIEAVALIVSSTAASKGRLVAATLMRITFIGCFLANLVCDIGAIVTYIDQDARGRADTVAVYNDAKDREAELTAKIDNLHTVLAKDDLDQATEALRIQLATEEGIVARTSITSPSRAPRERKVAKLKAALSNAAEIDRLTKARDEIRAQTSGKAAPAEAHPEIRTLEAMLGWYGFDVSSEEVQRAIAIGIAVVMRLLLGIGYWVAFPAKSADTADRDGDDGSGERKPWGIRWPSNLIDATRRFLDKRRNPGGGNARPLTGERTDDNSGQGAERPSLSPLRSQNSDRRESDMKVTPRSSDVPSAGIHVVRSPDGGPPREINPVEPKDRPTRPGRGRRHNPKTCPTCKTPLAVGDHQHGRLDALDVLDP